MPNRLLQKGSYFFFQVLICLKTYASISVYLSLGSSHSCKTKNMVRILFEFMSLRRAAHEGRPFRATLREIHVATPTACVETDDTELLHVSLPWTQRIHGMDAITGLPGSPFHLLVIVRRDVVTRVFLGISEASFSLAFEKGAISGEVGIVSLITTCCKEIRIVNLPLQIMSPSQERKRDWFVTVPEKEYNVSHLNIDFQFSPNQWKSMKVMRYLEEMCTQRPLRYTQTLEVIQNEVYLDSEEECFSTNGKWKHAHVRGGILVAPAGTGKTATMLAHCLSLPHDITNQPTEIVKGKYLARGTLVITPLNLPSHWQQEWLRVCPDARVIRIVSGRDAQSFTMNDLLTADIVLTTVYLLKGSKSYQELIENTIHKDTGIPRRDCRSKAAMAAWVRTAGRTVPIIQAVVWNRLVVDEIHEMFDHTAQMKVVRSLQARHVWGMTATLNTCAENLHNLYWLLRDDTAHNPNLLHSILNNCVVQCYEQVESSRTNIDWSCRSYIGLPEQSIEAMYGSRSTTLSPTLMYTSQVDACVQSLFLLAGSVHPTCANSSHAEDTIQLPNGLHCSHKLRLIQLENAHHSDVVPENEVDDVLFNSFHNAAPTRDVSRTNHDMIVRGVLHCSSASISDDIEAWDVKELCEAFAEDAMKASKNIQVDLNTLFLSIQAEPNHADTPNLLRKVLSRESAMDCIERQCTYAQEQARSLASKDVDVCPVCMLSPCGIIVSCGHLFCRACITQHISCGSSLHCPQCRSPISAEIRGISHDMDSKLHRIVKLVQELQQRIIIFVQWRQIIRWLRALFKGKGIQVFLLDGNATQRAHNLAHFQAASNGVLILSLEQSFAGLHLPHVQHIVFGHAIVADDEKVRMLEYQAIARCVRQGQAHTVQVHSFIARNTIDADVWFSTHSLS